MCVTILSSTPSRLTLIEAARKTGDMVAVLIQEAIDEFVVTAGPEETLLPGALRALRMADEHQPMAGFRTDGGALLLPASGCRIVAEPGVDWRASSNAIALPLHRTRRDHYFFGARAAPQRLPCLGHCCLAFESSVLVNGLDADSAVVWPPLVPFYYVSARLENEPTGLTIKTDRVSHFFYGENPKLTQADDTQLGTDPSYLCTEI